MDRTLQWNWNVKWTELEGEEGTEGYSSLDEKFLQDKAQLTRLISESYWEKRVKELDGNVS